MRLSRESKDCTLAEVDNLAVLTSNKQAREPLVGERTSSEKESHVSEKESHNFYF